MSRFPPGRQLDHYRIEELLGRGAYAETYKATDTRDGRTVVLKVPDPRLFAGDPNAFRRYRREAEVTGRLAHPGVQGAIDADERRSDEYLVLEYVDGVSMRVRIRTMDEPIPLATVLDWGRQVAESLAYLHANGVVHRDLKPDNLLIGQDNRVVIGDFGTAALEGARRLTNRRTTEGLGTPAYMSPEQVQGKRGDAVSDIYSWGVMMYELLTGRVPFEGDNWLAVLNGHLQQHPKPIHELRPDVPPALEAVVTKAMRRYPEHRYSSADALLADLRRLDDLDPATYDMTPEAPMGGTIAADRPRRVSKIGGLIVVGFLVICVAVITLSVLLR